MFTDADAVVPFGPITSSGKVTVPGFAGPELSVSVTLAVAVFVESAMLVAVIVMLCALEIVAGAVYTPFVSVPTDEFIDQ
jgi:hypothetical protein